MSLPRRTLCWPLFLLALFLAASCASRVKLAADYDPVLDEGVTELYVWTLEFLGQAPSARDRDDFGELLADFDSGARAAVSAMEVRASILENGLAQTPLTDNFASLKQQYAGLVTGLTPDDSGRALLDNPRVFKSTVEAFDQFFRAIMTHLLFLKGGDR